MAQKVLIESYDETYVKVVAERAILQEIQEQFTFFAEGYQFAPAYRAKYWDGKIRLLNLKTNLIYKGLIPDIKEFCLKNRYEFVYDHDITEIDADKIYQSLIKNIPLNPDYVPRDYQEEAFKLCIKDMRRLILSPTSSGKSLVLYLLSSYFLIHKMKVLIIVPTTGLVRQMKSDFDDYATKPFPIQMIAEGATKRIEQNCCVSTWQSIYKQTKEWFNQFDVVMADEAHLFEAKEVSSCIEKCTNVQYRFGFTGTLKDSKTNEMVLRGLFGDVYITTTTKELMNDDKVSKLEIRSLILKYSKEESKDIILQKDYNIEIGFIISHEKRMLFIEKMLGNIKGNTLLLFRYVEKHGKIIYERLKERYPDRPIIYIDGSVKGAVREEYRQLIESLNDAIIVASYGVFSTGISIKNLHNCIFCSPVKSKIKSLQSIGRILRKSTNKDIAYLYDICDALVYRSRKGFAFKHYIQRNEYYKAENFNVKTIMVEL